MTKKLICFFFLLLALPFFVFPTKVQARIGVGVGTGKIVVDEKLKSGIIYDLPSISVVNTGDEETDYALDITYQQDQPELQALKSWFSFSPSEFHLSPGSMQSVKVTLSLPLKTVPGDYFAYIEAHPVKKDENGSTSVSIAAASKLYFTVLPSSFLQGIYYRVTSFWVKYTPWTNILAAVVVTMVLVSLFKRFFNFNVQVKKKD